MVRRTDDPLWIDYARKVETRWRQQQADFGPNSVEALRIRDHLVRLYHKARRSAEPPLTGLPDPKQDARVATAKLLEGMLKR